MKINKSILLSTGASWKKKNKPPLSKTKNQRSTFCTCSWHHNKAKCREIPPLPPTQRRVWRIGGLAGCCVFWPLWSEFSTWNWGSHFRISYLTTVWPSKMNPNLRPNTTTMFPPRSFLQLDPNTSFVTEGSFFEVLELRLAVWGIFKNVYIYIYI